MRLIDYLSAIGDKTAAELFGVSERRIRSWRYGQRKPRPQTAVEIIRASNGRVTWAGIYHDSADKAQKSNLVTNKESH